MVLPKKNRLVKKKDFDTVFKDGVVIKGSFLLIKFNKKQEHGCRIGLSIPKKNYPKAASRNRLKRVITENISALISKGNFEGIDAIVIVKKKEKEELLCSELKKLLMSINH